MDDDIWNSIELKPQKVFFEASALYANYRFLGVFFTLAFETPKNNSCRSLAFSVRIQEAFGNYNMFPKHLIKIKQAVTREICVQRA